MIDAGECMEPLFTNKCTYTRVAYRELMFNYNKLLRTIVLIIVGLLLLLLIPEVVYSHNIAAIKLVCSIVISSALFFYLLPLIVALYMYMRDQHLYHEQISESITFYNEYFIETAYPSKTETRTAYSQIRRVVETKRFFFVGIKYQVFFIFDKDNFQGINDINFKRFIKRKSA